MFSILIVLSFFFKYALWLLIFSVIGVIVYLFYKKVSDYQENSDKPLNQDSDLDKASTTKALNYTPLTKAEIDAKYDEAKPNVHYSSNTKKSTSLISDKNINPITPQHKADYCNTPTQIKTQKEPIQTSNTTFEQAVKKPAPITNTMKINNDTPRKIITPAPKIHKVERGKVSVKEVFFDDKTIERLKDRYIAFDVETTGLNERSDRIIEVGAVLFENGQPTKKFSSLVNAEIDVPYSATVINLITTDMVRAAPSETTVYAQLADFLGDALDGTTIICAHNARFDISFLTETLERLGYNAKLSYIDTLSLSRIMIRGMKSYKLQTIAYYFKIENEQEHRADSDAEVCGMILSNFLSIKLKEQENIRQARKKREQTATNPTPVTDTMKINDGTPKNIISPASKIHTVKKGNVSTKGVNFDDKTIDRLKNRYIAFDVETTGLSAYSDRIIEVGAVLFENGQPTKEFGSLVNAEIAVPFSATSVNHITTDMVRSAPSETIVYTQLTDFLGDALDGITIICAHNARFDMTFLSETLRRLGYDATLSYVDTLSISRCMIHDLDNYKQPTIANYFKIENEQAHRAASDAKVCGSILSNLLSIKLKEQEQIRQAREQQEQEERIKKEAFIKLQKECHEKRESIAINPINERIPLNEIRNLNDDEKGYTEGYSFYCNGEVFRKANNFESALKEYDMARYNGYCYPAMYRSYAMIFHKLKDYENEIDILDEAIQRFQDNMQVCEQFEIRRNKAVIIFIEQQEKARIKAEKQNKLDERQKIQTSKSQLGRPILQLSDDMTVIKEFNSVSEAARSIGVSEKVIRETAKGRQKHAGGFVWKYADEIESNSLEKENIINS